MNFRCKFARRHVRKKKPKTIAVATKYKPKRAKKDYEIPITGAPESKQRFIEIPVTITHAPPPPPLKIKHYAIEKPPEPPRKIRVKMYEGQEATRGQPKTHRKSVLLDGNKIGHIDFQTSDAGMMALVTIKGLGTFRVPAKLDLHNQRLSIRSMRAVR